MLDITLGRVSPLSSKTLVTAHGREIDKNIWTQHSLHSGTLVIILESIFHIPFSMQSYNTLCQYRYIAVSRILHHIHLCLIYEAIMRHIIDKYEAIMKQISIIFSKNEVLCAAIFVSCQTTIKL